MESGSSGTQTSANSQYYQGFYGQPQGSFRGATATQSFFNGDVVAPTQPEVTVAEESTLSSYLPSRQTIGLLGILTAGLTLIGATTYFIATRYLRKKRSQK